jgi:hypothetical protein
MASIAACCWNTTPASEGPAPATTVSNLCWTFLPLQASVKSRWHWSHFHIGQRESTSLGGPAEDLWLVQTQTFNSSFAWVTVSSVHEGLLWLVQTPLPHPPASYVGRQFGSFLKPGGRHLSVLPSSVATLGPITGLSQVFFSCLHLIFITRRAGWAGNTERMAEAAAQWW